MVFGYIIIGLILLNAIIEIITILYELGTNIYTFIKKLCKHKKIVVAAKKYIYDSKISNIENKL
jgi:hypothetical protein